MSKMKAFVPRSEQPDPPEHTRRDKVLIAVSWSLGCLVIAGVLRGLFEVWQYLHR